MSSDEYIVHCSEFGCLPESVKIGLSDDISGLLMTFLGSVRNFRSFHGILEIVGPAAAVC